MNSKCSNREEEKSTHAEMPLDALLEEQPEMCANGN